MKHLCRFNMEQIELSTIDMRLEHARRKDSALEKRLLISIQQRDIQQPLQVVMHETQHDRAILIDGFKRYRCAVKLGIKTVPVERIGTDIVIGILALLRQNASKGFSAFEQAALVDELHKHYDMTIYDIATHLERSPSWVSVRLGLFDQLSPLVREKLMTGAFPVRAYMYSIKGFTRVNKVAPQRVDACVDALSGKNLSTRELSILVRAYFTGGKQLQEFITNGDVHRVLDMIKRTGAQSPPSSTVKQRCFIDELKTAAQSIKGILGTASSVDIGIDVDVLNSVNLWCAELIGTIPQFQTVIREMYDKSRYADGGSSALPAGAK
jgi:ParB/RepB/Spo0J family partition protein